MCPAFLRGMRSLGIHLLQRAGDAMRHGAGLAGHAAAGDVRGDIDLLAQVHREEGRVGLLGEILVGEIIVERPAVDDELAAADGDADAGRGGLRRPVAMKVFSGVLMDKIQAVTLTGFCASCVCFGPAKTRSLVSMVRAIRFFGSMPLTACSMMNSGCFSRIRASLR